ncbi:MAG: hypothetical protein GTO14_03880 [Anaerolineales bacterium]|nr:hypothetical protein [Anaerolineales bacterium]
MNDSTQSAGRFFGVMGSGQAYLNLLYLLTTFPLGIFYFVFLVTGLALGIPLVIIWLGIPILLLVGVAWWALASFERLMVIYWLKEDVPRMAYPSKEGADVWTRFKAYFTNPVTWKSLVYLFLKFPLGIATFVVVVTLVSLTLAFLTMPITYPYLQDFQVGIFLGTGLPAWEVDSMSDAMLAALIGLMLWPATLHVTNGLAWVHAKFARVMLSVNPMERSPVKVEEGQSLP